MRQWHQVQILLWGGACAPRSATNTTPDRYLQHALAFRRAGQLTEAERLCRQLLETAPQNADILHLLGVCVGQRGDAHQAVTLIRRALKIRPRFAEAHNNLGNFLQSLGAM